MKSIYIELNGIGVDCCFGNFFLMLSKVMLNFMLMVRLKILRVC